MKITNNQLPFAKFIIGDEMACCGIIWQKATNTIRRAVGYYGKKTTWKQNIIGHFFTTDPEALFYEIPTTNLIKEE